MNINFSRLLVLQKHDSNYKYKLSIPYLLTASPSAPNYINNI